MFNNLAKLKKLNSLKALRAIPTEAYNKCMANKPKPLNKLLYSYIVHENAVF